jgi:hypothetical protein
MFRAYVTRCGWRDSGQEYSPAQWGAVIEGAKQGLFNAVFASAGGLRWFAQIVPEREFAPPPPKREAPAPTTDVPEHDGVILERARVMMADERTQSAEDIAQSLLQDGLVTGSLSKISRMVRHALLRSGAFSVTNGGDGQPPLWRPWQSTSTTVEEPSGARVIHTQVLSTTGIPVNVAIPLKPITPELLADVRSLLSRAIVEDYQQSQGRQIPVPAPEVQRSEAKSELPKKPHGHRGPRA